MKYFEAIFTISPYSTDASDLLAALAGEAGFETFEETETGLKGYVQQSLFDAKLLEQVLADFPFDDVTVDYEVHEAEDKDWNEQWEAHGFDPIVINNGAIVIHDGRHDIPAGTRLAIEIDARLAFGTGTHETTRMICSMLLEMKSLCRILDCGTGTGILSICALKLGASEAVGYDIDEWSVDNARHNAVINQVDSHFTSLLGDASVLNSIEGSFDLVMANINRNILLADMPVFRKKMSAHARLILSGFYVSDAPLLIDKANSLGLTLESQKEDHEWCCLVFTC